MSQNVLRMPRLSDSMTEATIVGWLKQPGEAFVRGDPLVEVETDKATVVYEAEEDGLLGEILVPEGGSRGARRADRPARWCGGDGASQRPRGAARGGGGARATRRHRTVPVAAQPVAATRARATPVARRTAAQLGVSLLELDGTGPGGRIRKLDVMRAGAAIGSRPDAAAPVPGTTRPQGSDDGGRAVDDGPDDRAPHDAVAVRDPVVRRRHAGRHVDGRPAPPRRARCSSRRSRPSTTSSSRRSR